LLIIGCAESPLKGQILILNNPNESEMNADRQPVIELEGPESQIHKSVMGEVPVREIAATPAASSEAWEVAEWVDAPLELDPEVEG